MICLKGFLCISEDEVTGHCSSLFQYMCELQSDFKSFVMRHV